MLTRLITLTVLVALTGIAPARAQHVRPGASPAVKAERFYAQGEWASASAMYGLLLDSIHSQPRLWARAIVADGMRSDTAAQVALTRRALSARVAVDSLFGAVERESLAIGQADIYERYLEMLKRDEPWLARAVDGRLLRYFAFRRNPQATIAAARTMLAGRPDYEPYLMLLARAQLDAGLTSEAEATWRRVVSLNPRQRTALLYLAAAALQQGDKAKARPLLEEAQRLQATPTVAALLADK